MYNKSTIITFVALHNPVNEWPLKDTVNEETNVFLDLFMNFEKRKLNKEIYNKLQDRIQRTQILKEHLKNV